MERACCAGWQSEIYRDTYLKLIYLTYISDVEFAFALSMFETWGHIRRDMIGRDLTGSQCMHESHDVMDVKLVLVLVKRVTGILYTLSCRHG